MYVYSTNNKRSKDVFKLKIRPTLDVDVTGFTHGMGKDSDCIIWICNYNGNELRVVQN